jgi:hypothetical protein
MPAPKTNKSTFAAHLKSALQDRAKYYAVQRYLIADGYRIRRKLAYPLPIRHLSIPAVPVPGIPDYPWSTWMTWALEERIFSLGWAAELLADREAQSAVERDLEGLATWPQYRQAENLDLSLGHSGRILARSYHYWTWLHHDLREAIKIALQRLIATEKPLLEKYLGSYSTTADILSQPESHQVVHNIRLIGAMAVTMAACAIDAPEKSTFNRYIKNALEAILTLRETGFSEGVSYDGYVLDFVMDWLSFLPDEEKSTFLFHPQLTGIFDKELWQGVPGDVPDVAELGDVEAREMPFRFSAQAKLQAAFPLPSRAWYLSQCRLDWLRSDALAALLPLAENLTQTARMPPVVAADAHTALVLRSGWNAEDVAVVMAASNSPMGHIHPDNGSVTIGTRGKWFLQTSGYQQYMPNSEREFTTGPASRNTPLINGETQIAKAAEMTLLETQKRQQTVAIDLTQCYPEKLALQKIARRVRLTEKHLVEIEDEILGSNIRESTYFWHGHPGAAWWIEDGWARIYLEGETLWIGSPQVEIRESNLQRLRGSRGQLTLSAKVLLPRNAITICWFLKFGETRPST